MKKIFTPKGILINETVQFDMSIVTEYGMITDIIPKDEAAARYAGIPSENFSSLIFTAGTVNAHNHSFQSLLRGIGVDRPFLEWRDKTLYAYSDAMRLEDIYTGALFAFSEMMKCGATTVCDFFYLHNFGTDSDEAVVQAAHDCGIRLVLARTMYDWTGAPEGYCETIDTAYQNTEELIKKYSGPMTKVIPAPHSLHAASPEMILAGHDLSKKYDLPMHIHVAEEPFEVEQVKREHDGQTPLSYLHHLGVVDNNLCIIHGVWLSQEEISLLGRQGGNLIYCPSSNMFLADGITNIPAYLSAGVTIALGSDGACGNNRISVFEEMRMAPLLQKAAACNALCVTYHDAHAMGMENGGKVLGLPVGRMEKGYAADFVGVDCRDLSMQPLSRDNRQFLPHLIYSMQPSAIKLVIVNGETTVKDGALTKISDETLLHAVSRTINYLDDHV